jgi:hypothetical protein
MIWRKYHLYYLLSLVVLLSTFCFGVNKVNATVIKSWSDGTNIINYNNNDTITCSTCTTNQTINTLFQFSTVPIGNTYPMPIVLGGGIPWYIFDGSLAHAIYPQFAGFGTQIGYYEGGICFFPSQNDCSQSGYNMTGVDWYAFHYTVFSADEGVSGNVSIPTSINSFTYSTTTQTARVQGYWNATTTPDVTERLEFHQFSTMLGIESFTQVIATSTGLFDYSFEYRLLPTPATGTTTPAFTADTTLFARIYQYDNNYATDPFSGQFDSRYKTLLVATTTTITATTTDISTLLTGRDVFAYPEYECGITSLTGCIKNALIWAFYPTQDSIEQYKDFISLIQAKAPIGYFYTAKDSLTGLSATSTSNVFDIDIPYSLKRYIFTPFDIAIAGILWFFFLINFYKRFKTIQL